MPIPTVFSDAQRRDQGNVLEGYQRLLRARENYTPGDLEIQGGRRQMLKWRPMNRVIGAFGTGGDVERATGVLRPSVGGPSVDSVVATRTAPGITNPFGLISGAKRLWAGVRGKQDPYLASALEQARNDPSWRKLVDDYRQANIGGEDFRRLAPAAAHRLMSPEDMGRLHKANYKAQHLRNLDDYLRTTKRFIGGVPETIKATVDPYLGAYTPKAAAIKTAAFDWVVNLGNKYYDKRLDSALGDDVGARRKFFTDIGNAIDNKPQGLLSKLNPINWAKKYYLSDPRSMQHIMATTKARLSDPAVHAKLFPGRSNRFQALLELLGPKGTLSEGWGIGDVLTGRVKQQAYDPRTWVRAFAKDDPRAMNFLRRASALRFGNAAPKTAAYTLSPGLPSDLQAGLAMDARSNDEVGRILQQHVPTQYAKRQILRATNLSFNDKVDFVRAIDQQRVYNAESPRGTMSLGDILPALAGAGLGYLGASLVAPVFGMSDANKKRLGIGSAALGAVVNTFANPWRR